MAPDARYAADAAILKNLESLPEFAEASVIAAYASDGTEPDLMPLLKRAAGTGKTKQQAGPQCRQNAPVSEYQRRDSQITVSNIYRA